MPAGIMSGVSDDLWWAMPVLAARARGARLAYAMVDEDWPAARAALTARLGLAP